MTNSLDVVVVGAGPCGLILAKQLAATNLSFKVFERHSDVGGIWDIDAPGSPMYESAHFISSRTLSAFPSFPMPEEYPDYPNHRQLLAYIRSFAKALNLYRHIQFSTSVNSAVHNGDEGWTVELSDGSQVKAKYLVCANGVTWEPNIVEFAGEFNGEVRHSVTYRDPDEFKGKRVLVVGAGNSGVDIACDAAFAAEQAFISLRRGYHFLPKHIMGKPSDVFAEEGPKLPHRLTQIVFGFLLRLINGDLRKYGLPKPDHKLFETHPILNTQILHYLGHGDCIAKPDIGHFDGEEVVFVDGSRERIDLVITATGYQHSVPFIADGLIEYENGRPDLYLNMFPRNTVGNLAILGFIEFASAAYSSFTQMAELIVKDAQGSKKLAELKQSHYPDLKGGHHYLNTQRNANYVDGDTYAKVLWQVKAKLERAA